MKLVKELPKSILFSLFLHFVPTRFLISSKKEKLPVTVSLTSIPSRLNSLHIVIKSLFNQSHLPLKIILWLHEDLKTKLPKRLEKLQSNLFEIKYSHLTCSHRKLIHTLKEHQEAIIITCDDDLIYRGNLLINLYTEYLKFPNEITANTTYQIKFDNKNGYLPYNAWKFKAPPFNPKAQIPVGAWCILYPPNSLSNKVFNEDLFLKLTPKADDLWFKAMALLNGTNSRQSENPPKEPIPIIGSQKVALKKDNISKNKNDKQWAALSKHFNLDKLIKEN
ncbi:glycosyl transferase [Snuella lapsa]|uniref:Glycosyl transferase n=1 Tax=Snuella lapsa TaxID=870481 RepID=A0ABP6XYX0_9FLAO